jgi:hypothetical protein
VGTSRIRSCASAQAPWLLSLLVVGCSRSSLWPIAEDEHDDCTDSVCAGDGGGGYGGASGKGGKGGAGAGGQSVAGSAGRDFAGSGGRDVAGAGGGPSQSGAAGVGASAGRAGAPGCEAELTRCGNACVRLEDDPAHCGFCDNRCSDGATCSAASCACTLERAECGGRCVDVQSDPKNCGTCGLACEAGLRCRDGFCAPPECSAVTFESRFHPVERSVYVAPLELTGDGRRDLALITETDIVPFLNAGNGDFSQLASIPVTQGRRSPTTPPTYRRRS